MQISFLLTTAYKKYILKCNISPAKGTAFTMANGYKSVKNPATIKAQIEKLRSRGCIIEDEERAKFVLENVNYYRLVHYFSPFLENKGRYREGTTFEKVMRIYDFDRLLRSLILTVLEEVEISMRAHVSNFHALKYGALGYLNESCFDNRHHNHKHFLGKIDRLVETNTGEELVTHHMRKYGGAFPLWVIMELFSFGMLNTFYSDLKTDDKKAIADKAFAIPYRCVEDWLYCLSDLRNMCAHYNRLYANKMNSIPKQPPDFYRPMNDTLYDHIIILKELYPRDDTWRTTFIMRLEMLFMEYGDVIELEHIGFPKNWREELVR